MTIDFKTGGCTDDLAVFLVTNDTTTGRNDDWVFWGSCVDSGTTKNFCCIVEDDGAVNPEVTDVGIRGLDTDDLISLVETSSGFYRDSDMHTDLAVWVYGEGGVDFLVGSFSILNPPGTSVPETLRGGGDGDLIQGGDAPCTIYGDDGSDYIIAGDGVDTIYGGSGFDQIDGGLGGDVIYAGGDQDFVCGDLSSCSSGGGSCSGVDPTSWIMDCDADAAPVGGGGDTIRLEGGGTSSSMAFGQTATDRIYAGLTADVIDGGHGDDELVVNGSDLALGDIGQDKICGVTGSDEAFGEDDEDTLVAVSSGAFFADGGSDVDFCFPLALSVNCEFAASSCPFSP